MKTAKVAVAALVVLASSACKNAGELEDVGAAESDISGCFSTVTFIPNTPPTNTCNCNPYNPCESTLVGESCGPYSPVGPPDIDIDIVPSFYCWGGYEVLIWVKQIFCANCTIGYKCNGSTLTCGATGLKCLKRKRLVFWARVCPGGIQILVDKLALVPKPPPPAGLNPTIEELWWDDPPFEGEGIWYEVNDDDYHFEYDPGYWTDEQQSVLDDNEPWWDETGAPDPTEIENPYEPPPYEEPPPSEPPADVEEGARADVAGH